MFTGIVEELGEIVAAEDLGSAARLTVRGPVVTADARLGDSIAVDGVCLTVAEVAGQTFTADVMKQTRDRSSLIGRGPGHRVNLERAATLETRLGGHLVQGHVDGVGTLLRRTADPHWEILHVSLPDGLSRYVVDRGSIAIDGVSLTVVAVEAGSVAVSLIPTTLAITTLGLKRPGDRVNLEVDVIAKYVERLAAWHTGG